MSNIHKIFLAHFALDSLNAINKDNIGDIKNNINGKYWSRIALLLVKISYYR